MELVAAAKMRKAQESAVSGRPYSVSLDEILKEVKQKSPVENQPLLQENDSPNQIIILVSSDRGLAGGLNINLFRQIQRSDAKHASFITVGKKATTFVAKSGHQILASFASEEQSPLDLARTIAKMAIDAFIRKEASKITLLYPHFQSVVKQNPTYLELLPIEFNMETAQPNYPTTDLLFEPGADLILSQILPHFVLTQIYQVLLEAKASEFSARMVAMKNATDAAGDLVDDLTLTYNQARQEAITKELLDIITAQYAFE